MSYPRGVLGISSDGDDQMEPKVKTQKIRRASSKTQKNPWTKNKPPKNPTPILWPLKVPERGNAITRKTLEIDSRAGHENFRCAGRA